MRDLEDNGIRTSNDGPNSHTLNDPVFSSRKSQAAGRKSLNSEPQTDESVRQFSSHTDRIEERNSLSSRPSEFESRNLGNRSPIDSGSQQNTFRHEDQNRRHRSRSHNASDNEGDQAVRLNLESRIAPTQTRKSNEIAIEEVPEEDTHQQIRQRDVQRPAYRP